MPRTARVAPGGLVYHVINRAHGRLRLFRKDEDYLAFYKVMRQSLDRTPTRLLGWCIMGNHWHFVVWPREEGELARFFGYLGQVHATRWQVAHNTVGTGPVYQGRFKSFIIQQDQHLETVLHYVERNPLRAKRVSRSQDWRWSSLHARLRGPAEVAGMLSDWPIERRTHWTAFVNRPQIAAEESAISECLRRERPLGDADWLARTVKRYDLQSTLRPRGRQPGWRKTENKG